MDEFYPVDSDRPGPVEVWLTKTNIEVACRVIFEDETDTMRGAQREITAWLIGRGYQPAGRWQLEWQHQDEDDAGQEYSRAFRPGKQEVTAKPGLRAANQALAARLVDALAREFAKDPVADQQKVANWVKHLPTDGEGAGPLRYWPEGFTRPDSADWR